MRRDVMHLQTMKLFLIFVLLKGAHCQAIWGPKEITVMEHEDLTVECGYQRGYEIDEKYWCEGTTFISCSILAKTTSSKISRSGLFLSENKTHRVINIIMKDIQERDEGTYWCGISAAGRDEHSPVVVKVKTALPVFPTKQQDIITSGIAIDNSITTSSPARPTSRNTTSIQTGPLLGGWTVLRWILLCALLSCPILVTCWEKCCRSKHLSSQPASEHLSSQPASGHLSSQPASGHLSSQPASGHLRSKPASEHLSSQPASGRLRSQPASGRLRSQPASEPGSRPSCTRTAFMLKGSKN